MSKPLVFIPRRADKLAHTTDLVAQKGFAALPFPLIDYTPLPVVIEGEVQAIVLTSSAVLRSLPQTSLPVYCVGAQTAHEATERGFNVAHIGKGNAAALGQWLAENIDPQVLWHPTTADVENGWYAPLQARGFEIQAVHAYEKAYAKELPAEVVCCLTENKVSFTLVFSVQSARQLLELCQTHKISEKAMGTVIAISEKVAAQFNNKQLNVRVAKHPQLQEMLNVLEQTTQ